jgi:hypothetical protein
MQVIFLGPEVRFSVRVTEEGCARLPSGAFSPGASIPAYAMRIEGEGEDVRTYFMVPAADGFFYWLPATDLYLARR